MFRYSELKMALVGYIERTKEIRLLASPSIKQIGGAKAYRILLRESTARLNYLKSLNMQAMESFFLPLINSDEPLTEDEVRFLKEFTDVIQIAGDMEFMDASLLWEISKRLLKDARSKDDLDYLIEQLDLHIISCMGKMTQVKTIPGAQKYWQEIQASGIEALNEIFPMLEKERFAQIESETSRELLLINSRYFCVIYDVPGLDNDTKEMIIDRLIASYNMAFDPFYVELAPNYDWFRHKVKCSEYLGQLTERNNELCYTVEQCRKLLPFAEKLEELYAFNPERISSILSKFDIDVILTKARYYAGEITNEEFRKAYVEFYKTRMGKSSATYSLFTDFQMPNEYVGSLDRNNLSEEDISNISIVYQSAISCAFQLPNKDAFTAAIEYFSRMLERFIEVPGGLSFKDCCLNFLGAVMPRAYIHAVSTAQLARCICGHLCEHRPEIFLGLSGYNTVMTVLQHKEEICGFAYNAALLHDIGNIPMIQILEVAERELLDDEKELLALHPQVGWQLAKGAISTAKYAGIIREHNLKFYEANANAEEKAILDIIALADKLDEVIQKIENSGEIVNVDTINAAVEKRQEGDYAPYLEKLLTIPEVRRDLEFLLTDGRENIFRDTYVMLKEVQDRGEL